MSVEQIQQAVSRLPAPERRKLAAWMLAEYPPRAIDDLVARAEAEARCGVWTPQPPTADNIPTGAALARISELKTQSVASFRSRV